MVLRDAFRCNCGVKRCLHASHVGAVVVLRDAFTQAVRVDCSAVGLNRAVDLLMKYSFAFSYF